MKLIVLLITCMAKIKYSHCWSYHIFPTYLLPPRPLFLLTRNYHQGAWQIQYNLNSFASTHHRSTIVSTLLFKRHYYQPKRFPGHKMHQNTIMSLGNCEILLVLYNFNYDVVLGLEVFWHMFFICILISIVCLRNHKNLTMVDSQLLSFAFFLHLDSIYYT